MRATVGVDRAQRLDLLGALELRIPFEVRRDHAHLAERRDDRRLEREPRHAVDAGIDGEWQQVPEHLPHGKARCDQVAEVPAIVVVAWMVDRDAGDRDVARQERRDRRELVFAGAACEARIREVGSDLLQAKHIEVGDAFGFGDDGGGIYAAVDAATPLRIPRDDLHRMPARMNDWTNCRWKRRNAIRSGAVVRSVAAVMTDQSMPWSVAENTCSPTVTGRDSTEFVMM